VGLREDFATDDAGQTEYAGSEEREARGFRGGSSGGQDLDTQVFSVRAEGSDDTCTVIEIRQRELNTGPIAKSDDLGIWSPVDVIARNYAQEIECAGSTEAAALWAGQSEIDGNTQSVIRRQSVEAGREGCVDGESIGVHGSGDSVEREAGARECPGVTVAVVVGGRRVCKRCGAAKCFSVGDGSDSQSRNGSKGTYKVTHEWVFLQVESHVRSMVARRVQYWSYCRSHAKRENPAAGESLVRLLVILYRIAMFSTIHVQKIA